MGFDNFGKNGNFANSVICSFCLIANFGKIGDFCKNVNFVKLRISEPFAIFV